MKRNELDLCRRLFQNYFGVQHYNVRKRQFDTRWKGFLNAFKAKVAAYYAGEHGGMSYDAWVFQNMLRRRKEQMEQAGKRLVNS